MDTPLPFNLDELRAAILHEEITSGRLDKPPFLHQSMTKIRDGIAMATTAKFLSEHILPNPGYRAHLIGLIEKWRAKHVVT